MKILCLSNGHGEDAIAVRILQELQQHPNGPQIEALPLAGEGRAYTQLDIPIVGPVQAMPSGGFIYMDGRQLARDLRGGLLQLTLAQLKAVKTWAKQGGAILAVGDIVPLLFAWFSGVPYAFVGTAKSEYYIQDEAGPLPRKSWFEEMEGWFGSVYLPWERWLMSRPRCQAVFPRDTLTTTTLQQWSIPAFDLGNPMMDGLEPTLQPSVFYPSNAEQLEVQRLLTITLLPGSRSPEAYTNWQTIMQAVPGAIAAFTNRSLLFLAAIAPGLDLEPLREVLAIQGWRQQTSADSVNQLLIADPTALTFTQKNATLMLTQHAFNDCLHQADLAIAMAGTATEQFVGLGKPAITIPGQGPQFTPAFAEAQSRHLGPSIIPVNQPDQVAKAIQSLLNDPDRLQLIADNGPRRMGAPGAARRIANCLMEHLEGLKGYT
jgi:uncharacterized protein (TIGR03492 family)